MTSTTRLVSTVAPYFVPYLLLRKLTGEQYYFRKESTRLRNEFGKPRFWHPMIEHTMLRDHHSRTENILYAAFPAAVDLKNLKPDDLLYIGCSMQGGQRFWRGRPNETDNFPTRKSCFHHGQMRGGRSGSNLENYLATGGEVKLHTLTDPEIEAIVTKQHLTLPDGRYIAHRMEKLILSEGFKNWCWNSKS